MLKGLSKLKYYEEISIKYYDTSKKDYEMSPYAKLNIQNILQTQDEYTIIRW